MGDLPQEIRKTPVTKNVAFRVTKEKKTSRIIKIRKLDAKKRPKSKVIRKKDLIRASPLDPNLLACKQCGMTFKNGVSLGGHASKAHPGASAAYTHKVQVRQAREAERAYLKKAKEWFTDHFVADPKG